MNAFEKFLVAMDKGMDTPQPLGTFHIVTIALILLTTVMLCVFCRNTSEKRFQLIVFIFWIAILIFEVYKQIVFSIRVEDGVLHWGYVWSHFPFQFCDTPIYLFPLVIFLKDGKLRDATMAFLASYTLFAGLLVLACPDTVFSSSLGGNIHTMFHHGTQIALGVYIAVYARKKLTLKTFLYAILIFVILVAVAQILNVIIHNYVTEDYFNLYYISPYFHRSYPWVGAIGAKYHWSIVTLVYTAGFTVIAFIVYITELGIIRLCRKKEPKNGK